MRWNKKLDASSGAALQLLAKGHATVLLNSLEFIMNLYRSSALAVICSALSSTTFAQHHKVDRSRHEAQLREVATFEHQVTGVTVSADGRKFVNFPRWTEDAPVSVAELTADGDLRPYP